MTPRSDQDMRREIVLREVNQGALAGMATQITEQAAQLVLDALDRYDTWAITPEMPDHVRAWMDEANETGAHPMVVAVDGKTGAELFRGGFEGYMDRPTVVIKVGPRVYAHWAQELCRPIDSQSEATQEKTP